MKLNQSFGGEYRLCLHDQKLILALVATCFTLVSCLSYYSNLKIEATRSS
jgi:hypothetical protein